MKSRWKQNKDCMSAFSLLSADGQHIQIIYHISTINAIKNKKQFWYTFGKFWCGLPLNWIKQSLIPEQWLQFGRNRGIDCPSVRRRDGFFIYIPVDLRYNE